MNINNLINSTINKAKILSSSANGFKENFLERHTANLIDQKYNQTRIYTRKVAKHDLEVANLQDKINNPPTTEVVSDKGKLKTVVDQKELNKIKIEQKKALASLNETKKAVEEGKLQAKVAAAKAMESLGLDTKTQESIESTLSKSEKIKQDLKEGKNINVNELIELTQEFDKTSKKLTSIKQNNLLMRSAFYKPFIHNLKEINKLSNGKKELNALEEEKRNKENLELFSIRILDTNKRNQILDLKQNLSNFKQGLEKNKNKFNKSFSRENFKKLISENDAIRSSLTDEQKSHKIFEDMNKTIDDIKTSTNYEK